MLASPLRLALAAGLFLALLLATLNAGQPPVKGAEGATLPGAAGAASAEGESEPPRYRTVPEIEAYLEGVAANHSDIAGLESLGRTVEDRPIWALKLSDNPGQREDGLPGSEPGVLYVGVHHANEWLGAEVLVYFIDYLIRNYGAEATDWDGDGLAGEDLWNGVDDDGDGAVDEDPNPARATWLVNNRELWFVPVLNPDGMAYDMAQGPQGGDWRKNREPNPDGSVGTDLNRNYPWHWGEPGFNDPYPDSDFYEGPPDLTDNDGDLLVDEDKVDGVDNDGDGEVDEDRNGGFSTRETRAMRDLVERENLSMALSYHTAGNQVLYPWGYTYDETPEDDLFRALAGDMAAMNGYEAMQGSDLYPTAGEFTDWLYGSHHIYGFTLELADQSGGDEYVDPEQIEPISRLNLPVNLYVAERAGEPQAALEPDLGPPRVEVEPGPATVSAQQSYPLRVRVTSAEGEPLTGAGVEARYLVRPEAWPAGERVGATTEAFAVVSLAEVEPGLYEGVLPPQPEGRRVYYYVSGSDGGPAGQGQSPLYAPYELHAYGVAEGGAGPNRIWIGGALLLAAAVAVVGSRKLWSKGK